MVNIVNWRNAENRFPLGTWFDFGFFIFAEILVCQNEIFVQCARQT